MAKWHSPWTWRLTRQRQEEKNLYIKYKEHTHFLNWGFNFSIIWSIISFSKRWNFTLSSVKEICKSYFFIIYHLSDLIYYWLYIQQKYEEHFLSFILSNNLCVLLFLQWSYGIVLWELMSGCKIPYGGVDNWDVSAFIRSGRRLQKPGKCPDHLYKLMERCWQIEPTDRPSFPDILVELKTEANHV